MATDQNLAIAHPNINYFFAILLCDIRYVKSGCFFERGCMTSEQFLQLIVLLIPGLLLSALVMGSFAKGG